MGNRRLKFIPAETCGCGSTSPSACIWFKCGQPNPEAHVYKHTLFQATSGKFNQQPTCLITLRTEIEQILGYGASLTSSTPHKFGKCGKMWTLAALHYCLREGPKTASFALLLIPRPPHISLHQTLHKLASSPSGHNPFGRHLDSTPFAGLSPKERQAIHAKLDIVETAIWTNYAQKLSGEVLGENGSGGNNGDAQGWKDWAYSHVVKAPEEIFKIEPDEKESKEDRLSHCSTNVRRQLPTTPQPYYPHYPYIHPVCIRHASVPPPLTGNYTRQQRMYIHPPTRGPGRLLMAGSPSMENQYPDHPSGFHGECGYVREVKTESRGSGSQQAEHLHFFGDGVNGAKHTSPSLTPTTPILQHGLSATPSSLPWLSSQSPISNDLKNQSFNHDRFLNPPNSFPTIYQTPGSTPLSYEEMNHHLATTRDLGLRLGLRPGTDESYFTEYLGSEEAACLSHAYEAPSPSPEPISTRELPIRTGRPNALSVPHSQNQNTFHPLPIHPSKLKPQVRSPLSPDVCKQDSERLLSFVLNDHKVSNMNQEMLQHKSKTNSGPIEAGVIVPGKESPFWHDSQCVCDDCEDFRDIVGWRMTSDDRVEGDVGRYDQQRQRQLQCKGVWRSDGERLV